MEDTLKSMWINGVLIGIFIIAILSFITMFPSEQGIQITGTDNITFTNINNTVNSFQSDISSQLSSTENDSDTSYNSWNILVGFMGSSTVKQGTKTSTTQYFKLIFTTLKSLVIDVFTFNSPIVSIISLLITALGIYLIWALFQFIRTGR